jgi:hypothetical protein
MTTTTNGHPLSTHEATISTATIAIKVLTLGKKQMTLAVFRQLKQEPLVDPTAVLLGTVNHFVGECAPTVFTRGRYHHNCDPHLHVVWQKGQELRRSCVFREGDRRGYTQTDLWQPGDVSTDAQRYAELEALDQLFIAV